MSTNSTIAIKTDKGYEAIYCHNDGYPSYMYPMLRDWYGTEERANALIDLGDASFIAKRLMPSQGSDHHFDHPEEDVCIFYHRDRGEEWNAAFYGNLVAVTSSQYYTYVFEDGEWHVYIRGVEADDYSEFDD
jgi:predicted CxxxxCH...CXXCH cytochrome family protein